ncbi:MAG: hypothetical protein AAF501_15755, partial [Pseudomonadota bacterium]
MALRSLALTAAILSLAIPYPLGAQGISGNGVPEPVSRPFGPAVDWKLTAETSQRFTADTNRSLNAESDGNVYGSTTLLGLKLDAETERTFVTLRGGLVAAVFGGPGDTSELDRIDPQFEAGLRYDGKDYRFNTDLDIDVEPTSFTQLEDTGILEDETTQITVTYAASYSKTLNARNQAFVNGFARAIRFAEDVDGLNETTTGGFDAGWSHQLSATTRVTGDTGFRYFTSDNAAETTSQVVDFSIGVDHQRTRRHTFEVAGGASFIRQETNNAFGGRSTEYFTGFNGGASFDYEIPRFRLGLNLRQRVDPSSQGVLRSFTRLSGSIGYRLNSRLRLSGALGISRRTELGSTDGDQRDFVSIGPRLSYEVTDDVDLGLNYQFRLSNETDEDIATGH